MIIVTCVLALVLTACSSDNSESSRKRRADAKKTTTTSKEGENTTTAPTVAPNDTKPIVERPFLSGAQIKTEWPQAKLCGLISNENVAQVLNMTTAPTPEYVHAQELGANCRWNKGNGDSASIEISTLSFKSARDIDASLNAHGQAIVVSGVAGVIKTNGLGAFIELNLSGENSNQWVANAPDQEAAKKLAEFLITSINK